MLAATQVFVEQYMALPEGSAGRLRIERQYGRANLTRLVNKYEEEKANKELLDSCATECPGCMVYVEKSMGCNHVGSYWISLVTEIDLSTDEMYPM